MQLVIAEKSSVTMSINAIIGAKNECINKVETVSSFV